MDQVSCLFCIYKVLLGKNHVYNFTFPSMAVALRNNGRVEYLVATETIACVAENICYVRPKRQKELRARMKYV